VTCLADRISAVTLAPFGRHLRRNGAASRLRALQFLESGVELLPIRAVLSDHLLGLSLITPCFVASSWTRTRPSRDPASSYLSRFFLPSALKSGGYQAPSPTPSAFQAGDGGYPQLRAEPGRRRSVRPDHGSPDLARVLSDDRVRPRNLPGSDGRGGFVQRPASTRGRRDPAGVE
jgi:hypothetical protein